MQASSPSNLPSVVEEHLRCGRFAEAEELCRQSLSKHPSDAQARNALGVVLQTTGRIDEAVETFKQAVESDPANAVAFSNLGSALRLAHRFADSVRALREAIRLKPDHAPAYMNLGITLADANQIDGAIEALRIALSLDPNLAQAHYNLGNAMKDVGQLDQAMDCYRRAIQLNPNLLEAYDCLAYVCNFQAHDDPKIIFNECLRWSQRFEQPLAAKIRAHPNDRSVERRLRIGYVSADFKSHPIGRFMAPVFASHDHAQFEIFAYSAVQSTDETTDELKGHADAWREIESISDDDAADLIRRDQIDILVDLSMHMADNRLPIFAQKPAPVQATYLAYAGTTGLRTIDYRLTDPYIDPPGSSDEFYTEKSIRLATSYWCYAPPLPDSPTVSVRPDSNTVIFGCLNNFCKVTTQTFQTWARVMQSVPNSRLIIYAISGSHRDRTRDFFNTLAIDPSRIEFVDSQPMREYLQTYNRIDISLDPFPYVGGTTTCDSLWMGVPVVTFSGRTAISRGGVSILSNIGLPEFIARTPDQYIQIAVDLAGNPSRRAELRRTMRDRMQSSRLMNASAFVADLENAYRQMWRAWCARPR